MRTRIRCSKLDRVISCPGSLVLEKLVSERDGAEGAEGTLIHNEIARQAIAQLGAATDALLPPEQGDGSHLPLNSAWIVGYCIRELAEKLPADYSLEVEVPLAYLFDNFGDFDLSGHIDALALSPDATDAIFWDWKTGYNAVDAAECNEQVLGYSMLIFRAYPSLKRIVAYIVQPRNDDELFQRVTKVEITPSEEMMERCERRIQAAIDNSTQLESGYKQCRFCPAAMPKDGPPCPALVAELKTMKMQLTPDLLERYKQQPDDAAIGDFVCTAKTLAEPIEAANEIARARIAEKGFITAANGTHISVKETGGSYEVTDRDGFHTALLGVIRPERLPHVTSPSMTEIKREIAEKFSVPITGKAAITGDSMFKAKLGPFYKQGKRQVLVFS